MSAHSASAGRGWLSALVAQVSEFVFEAVEEPVAEPEPVELRAHPVLAVVAAAPGCGSTTVARMLGAELARHAGGAAIVTARAVTRRPAAPARASARLATALAGVGPVQPLGRICLLGGVEPGDAVAAGRYLAPVVLDLPADGSAAGVVSIADHVAVVAAAAGEPALLEAVAAIVGGDPVKVANRVTDPDPWRDRADILLPDSRIAARAAALGTRPPGPLGTAMAELAEALAG